MAKPTRFLWSRVITSGALMRQSLAGALHRRIGFPGMYHLYSYISCEKRSVSFLTSFSLFSLLTYYRPSLFSLFSLFYLASLLSLFLLSLSLSSTLRTRVTPGVSLQMFSFIVSIIIRSCGCEKSECLFGKSPPLLKREALSEQ